MQHGATERGARPPQVLDGTGGERLLSTGRPDTAMMPHKPHANRYRGHINHRRGRQTRPPRDHHRDERRKLPPTLGHQTQSTGPNPCRYTQRRHQQRHTNTVGSCQRQSSIQARPHNYFDRCAIGYHWRVLVEADIRRLKQVIGDGLRSRTDRRRATEVSIAVHGMNRMLELGHPDYVRTV